MVKKTVCIISLLMLFKASLTFALPNDDFEPWTMYQTYVNGYDVGKDILKGSFGNVSLLEGCLEKSDHSFWKSLGWNNKTIKKSEKLYFFGCMNASDKKMTKEEFKKMYKIRIEK